MDVTRLFQWHSRRARYSRYGHALRQWRVVLEMATFILLLLGVALLSLGLSIGWVLVGVSPLAAMIVQWLEGELSRVPRIATVRTVDARTDSELLALVPQQASPRQLAYALMNVSGGHFFEVRFGVGGSFLKEVVSDDPHETETIYEEALSLSERFGNRISAGVMILAMIRQLPQRQALLGRLQLDEDDIIHGIEWYHHLETVIDAMNHSPASYGGIGRDWSFGYIPQLMSFGRNLSQAGTMARETSRTETIRGLISSLEAGAGTVALVGRDGVGKTELLYKLAEVLMRGGADVPHSLKYQQVFLLDATRILSEAGGRGKLEALVSSLLDEAIAAKNIIVCLDNAELFFEDGVGSVNIASVLTPFIEAASPRMILTLNEEKYLQLSKKLPAVANALHPIMVEPTDAAETLRVLEDHAPITEHQQGVTYMYQALKEAYALSQRYVYDRSMPGQAITLLQRAAEFAEQGLVTMKSVAMAIEKTTGVKTAAVDDGQERQTLLHLEELIHERMIGQERAVSAVSDALRRARSGVRNQNRPVGTFLFLGPTGVGKTELAKALAEVYFGGEQNIIRIDMNEFVTLEDVSRLIADGADDPTSLTAQVMKQPFSVVLLDEIEKAHSAVLTTLLQLLDEGVLRDARNREVSFRDTVVVATSNAGADRIQEYIHRGYGLAQFEQTFIDELISSHIFHPEFLNRFDEMVVFAPLTKEQLLKVVDLILVGVNKNLADQSITVTVNPDAKELLVEAGYDPRLGARPMRRIVQKVVENTVAKLLLEQSVSPGDSIEITREHVLAIVEAKTQADQIAADNKKT